MAIEGKASGRSLAQNVYKTIVQVEACIECAEAGCPDPVHAGLAKVATWQDTTAGAHCGACGKKSFDLKICPRCSQIGFCDKACQKLVWSAHRLGCNKKPPPTPAMVDDSSFADKLRILSEHGAAHAPLALHIVDFLTSKFLDDDTEDEQMNVTYMTDAATEAEVLSAIPIVDATKAAFPQHAEIAKLTTMLRRLLRTKLWHCQGGEESGTPRPSDEEGLEEAIPLMDVRELKHIIALLGWGFGDCKSKSDFIALAKKACESHAARRSLAAAGDGAPQAAPPPQPGKLVKVSKFKGKTAAPPQPLGSVPKCPLWLPTGCEVCAKPLADADGKPGTATWCCGASLCNECGVLEVKKLKPRQACRFCGHAPHPAFMSGRQTIECLTALADSGSAEGQFALAIKYRDGVDGLQEEPMKAAYLLQQAVDQGCTKSIVRLADLLLGCGGPGSSGPEVGYQGVPLDDESGVRLMALAAEAGHPLAQYNVGFMLGRGINGLPRDPEGAMRWFHLAASNGNMLSNSELFARLAVKGGVQGATAPGEIDAIRMFILYLRTVALPAPTAEQVMSAMATQTRMPVPEFLDPRHSGEELKNQMDQMMTYMDTLKEQAVGDIEAGSSSSSQVAKSDQSKKSKKPSNGSSKKKNKNKP